MTIFIEFPNTERQSYVISEFEDLNPIFSTYPATHEIALNSHSLQEAVENIVEYLSSSHMTAWTSGEDLSKTLKSKALALGLSLSTALSPTISQSRPAEIKPTPIHKPAEDTASKSSFGTHPLDKFLWNVQQIESSGGKNTKHLPIKQGRFKGMRAMGKWGLLKPTVSELVNRMRLAGELTPEYQKLDQMPRDQMDEHLKKNPEMELHLVRRLAEHVLKRQNGDEHKAAYAWLNGHNLFPQNIKKEHLINSDYVSKYKAFNKLNPFKPQERQIANVDLNKMQYNIDSSDFRMRVRNWYKQREENLTENPTRSSNFQPDMGRIREEELDQVKSSSQLSSEERLKHNIKRANKKA
jgi:hypothetical protein